ncbi:MAG: 23S rRNA (adenine(2503)-C(2))-methyltransferase RlmN [Candidatus Magasanikbacteria bacterium]|jgi:23S rRNA (adenine2503-C2)-methyltransferase|nr:23S rRNA (adenine(2503)-C(2))-methyltransferase RlmN [Candidatus Magasanikbacteria bacterium]MBT4315337.1 23S rRNA (adenine(2503)-C(2))-methyltransferase RlmN [Candidatus Magasanikbacteria bacterium]MBT4547210.1 23S rRNA (adenine(2503)-C(2))-methyltransferase RlmN [Candidatus Magasanikbacteria bacterium]MBT6818802.1 23S rRNA (adenine(2503)-C(2))-methyltransferase RlmN [Candidatus Magasanikbacteria bacterium]
MNLKGLQIVLAGQPKFRFKQAWKAVFVDLISDWNDNTTLPKDLREVLNSECSLDVEAEIFGSEKSESVKALLTLEDDQKIETVLLRHKDGRNTICLSSQVGCALGCAFCATGKMGFKRDLTVSEIILQVLLFARYLKENKSEKNITNVVFMGMGEPFLNFDNVMESIKILNDKEAFNIGARHISVSTAGIVEEINKFANEKMQINLAISLHASNDKLRAELMPVARKYSLNQLFEAIENYVEKRSRQVMFEYLLIDGVNDSEYHAKELAGLMKHPLYVVNLIRYNPTGGRFRPSTATSIRKFKNILLREGIKVTERHEFGQDIKAACGQLAGRKK